MKKIKEIKTIAFDAMFLALIFVFAYVPYLGYITIGPLAFTTMHVLVLLGAILFGAKRGALYGFFFGVSSLLVALQYPGTLNYFCLNPFISIVPRVLFGLIAGLVFDALKKNCTQKTFNIVSIPLCGVFTLLHTVLYFTFFYVFGVRDVFGITSLLGVADLIESMNSTYGSLLGFIGSYMSIGCVCEIAVAIVLIGAIYLPVSKFLGLGRVKTIEEREVKTGNIAFNTTLVITLFALLCVIILSMAL